MVWTNGAGSYGSGWASSGAGLSVPEGGTLYIKYHSDAAGAGLYYAEHGRRWGEWRTMGPAPASGVGTHPNEPVILKISNIGTAGSTAAWVNGPGKSGIWSGLPTPGPYDLGLHADARWTLPPVVVTAAPQPPSFWANLRGWLTEEPPPPTDVIYPVPDSGHPILLSTLALIVLAMLQRTRT